jgi:hypothetical protein
MPFRLQDGDRSPAQRGSLEGRSPAGYFPTPAACPAILVPALRQYARLLFARCKSSGNLATLAAMRRA